MAGRPTVKATLENVVHTQLATTLGKDGVMVGTVEHLLAAFAGLGIDNAKVEVSGAEIPVMDGSSAPFVYLIKTAGVKPQSKYKKFIVVTKPVSVEDKDKSARVEPCRELCIDYSISFDHPLIRSQEMKFRFSDVRFDRELSRARTFGFLHEMEYMKKNGYAKGGSLANAVVLDRFRILNQDGLRFQDEFVRHKLLDFMGDISLIGAPIIGRFSVSKSGHTLNHNLMTELKANTDAWKYVEFSDPSHCRDQNLSVPNWGILEGASPSRAAAA